ncbi:MAG: translation initiation factor IF-3 [Verrucomicrobia bacterium]|nr:MAG: translation initiation factor IF-3 [Verrucomicrobiota bacterium]
MIKLQHQFRVNGRIRAREVRVIFGSTGEQLGILERDRRPAGARLKELKFRVNIDEHDYLTKVRHGEEFLDRGNKVRVQLQFRGREMAHQELGLHLMEKVREDLSGMSQVETEPKITGRNLTMTLTPLPANRRKRKFMVRPKESDQTEPTGSSSSS